MGSENEEMGKYQRMIGGWVSIRGREVIGWMIGGLVLLIRSLDNYISIKLDYEL